MTDYSVAAAGFARRKKIAGAFSYVFVALAAACMIGMIAALLFFLFHQTEVLYPILIAAFLGGALGFGALGFLLARLSGRYLLSEQDNEELAEGENSFLVGEATFATFEKDALKLHAAAKTVRIPYAELRIFSVCVRRAPKERGERKVVFELPASYILKDAKKDEPPVLIETRAKPRLYDCLRAHGLTVSGEQAGGAEKRFTRERTFRLPDPKLRNRTLAFCVGGGVLAGAGLGVVFAYAPIGAVMIVFGGYLTLYGGLRFLRARTVFSVYAEGIFYRDALRANRSFLKWEEIVSCSVREENGILVLKAECAYGAYEYPVSGAAVRFLKERYPEKLTEGGAE